MREGARPISRPYPILRPEQNTSKPQTQITVGEKHFESAIRHELQRQPFERGLGEGGNGSSLLMTHVHMCEFLSLVYT
jgi:hypothetical protein